jgi:hypothetical protein
MAIKKACGGNNPDMIFWLIRRRLCNGHGVLVLAANLAKTMGVPNRAMLKLMPSQKHC